MKKLEWTTMKKLEWTTKRIKVADLIELEFNPRKISEEKKKKLIESLEKFNLVEIPAVNTDMKIIGGNQRVKALVIAGRGDELIDVRVPNRKLTQKEVKEYNLISNSHAGEFDFDIIMSDFGDIDFADIGFDIGKIEFETSDLFEKSFDKFEEKKEIQNKSLVEDDNFDESEVEIKTDIVYGDLFQIGRHRLLCGNAFISDDIVKLMGTQKASIAFTDPPYDLEKEDYAVNLMMFTENAHVFVMHDDKGIINYLRQSKLNFKRFFVADFQFSSPRGNDPYLRHILISHEENGKPIKHQNLYDGFSSILKLEYRFRNKEENYGHKHQKPINFISNFINHYSEESSICLDLFGGSGSTMATCEQLNRQCYMTELTPENCQRIINRMEKVYNLKAIKL